MTHSERIAARAAEISKNTGIDDDMIERLVHAFYDKVRDDPLLGPVFEERISDWSTHLQRMCSFWSSVALKSGQYNGQPMVKHIPLPVDSRHFNKWLSLFEQTTLEICPPIAAGHFMEYAGRIAESLELGIAIKHGFSLMKGERLQRPDTHVYLPENA